MSLTIHERGGSAGFCGLLTSPPTLLAFTPSPALPSVSFLPPLPITDMWQRTGAQHYGTVWPGPRSWPTAHRLQIVAPSCCRTARYLPYLPVRLPPRARIPAHFPTAYHLPPFSFAPDQSNFPPGAPLFRQRHIKPDCNNTLYWRAISKYPLYSCFCCLARPMASPRQPSARTT